MNMKRLTEAGQALFSLGLVLTLVGLAWTAEPDYLKPRVPNLPKVTSVEPLLPNARIYVKSTDYGLKNGAGIKQGEKVVIVYDKSVDSLVVQALETAIREIPGTTVEIIKLEGFPGLTDAADIMEKYLLTMWWPEWVWDAVKDCDVVIPIARFTDVHLLPDGWNSKRNTRWARFPYVTRDLLVADTIPFPDEVYQALNQKLWEAVKGARTIRVTDPGGTDLTIEMDPGYWQSRETDLRRMTASGRGPAFQDPVSGHFTILPSWGKSKANGKIVVGAMHTGLIPRMVLTVTNSRITGVEGGGKMGEQFRRVHETFKEVQYPGFPGPGVNWLEEISMGTQPKAIRMLNYEEAKGGIRWWGFAQSRARSGALHLAIGTSLGGGQRTLDFIKEKGLPLNHRDTELYHATYIADGKVIVKDGHLTLLDNPEIRQIAAKYGNPDELLREDWIPEILK